MRRGVEMWGESQSPAHSIGTIPLALQSRVRQATEWPRRRAPKCAWGRVSGLKTAGSGDSDDRAAAGGRDWGVHKGGQSRSRAWSCLPHSQ